MARKGNIDNLDPIRSKEVARERQKLSAAKRSENAKERKAVMAMLEDRLRAKGYSDLDEALEGLINRAKDSDKALELMLAIMGEKPKEQIEIAQDKPFEVHIEVVE